MAKKKTSAARSRRNPTTIVDSVLDRIEKAIPKEHQKSFRDRRGQLEKGVQQVLKQTAPQRAEFQKMVDRVAQRADVEKLQKQVQELTRQVEKLVRTATASGAAASRQASRE